MYVPKKSGNKYYNEKVTLFGETFDSKHEAEEYLALRDLQRKGKIRNLRRQVRYELIPKQYVDGKLAEKSVVYVADFVYELPTGKIVVEDAKGYKRGTAYAVFVIKRKLMLQVHGIQVKEV